MAEKRVRRKFIDIIIDKLEDRYADVDSSKKATLFKNVKSIIDELEDLKTQSKKSKLTKAKINRLSKFSKEELEEYLKSIK
jgi:hypothetical protein